MNGCPECDERKQQAIRDKKAALESKKKIAIEKMKQYEAEFRRRYPQYGKVPRDDWEVKLYTNCFMLIHGRTPTDEEYNKVNVE